MKISLFQMDIQVENQQKNVEKAFEWIEQAHGADIMVMPELWNTGFRFDNIQESWVDNNSDLIHDLASAAKHHSAVIAAGSVIEKQEGCFYNTAYIFGKNGEIAGKYSKIHLFKPMEEAKYITPGTEEMVCDTGGISMGMSICYDIRFPELYRRMALHKPQIIFLCAQFPRPRQDHFDVLCQARAIENQCFFVAVNRVGTQKSSEFFGHSRIVDPWGEILNTDYEDERIITVEIDIEEVARSRKRLSVLDDITLIKRG